MRDINAAISQASQDSGLEFSLFVGPVDGPVRSYAERLHAALGPRAGRAVLVCVAPGERALEIVTGEESARRLGDRACGLAAMSMSSTFATGELVQGIVSGVRMLAEAAGRVRSTA